MNVHDNNTNGSRSVPLQIDESPDRIGAQAPPVPGPNEPDATEEAVTPGTDSFATRAGKRDQDMLTSNVADLVPVEMPWTGTRRSPLILFETPYRQLIPFSMFDPDLSDANGLLMAKSGGGKTLAAQQMLLMAARANPLISILERGDSYQPLVELMGGEMIEMSLDSDQAINPWDLSKGETKPSNDQISFLKNLTRHMLGENTPPDLDIDLLDSVLLEAIASTYKRCSAKTSNPVPLYGDLAAELAHWQDRDRNQKINAMAQMASTKLRAWVDDGPYARLSDRPTTVKLDNPWLYFNVEKLKDDPRLERAMSLLIAHTATYRASGLSGRPSIVLLDECWALLESPILASVVVQLFRTARERSASVWGISHPVNCSRECSSLLLRRMPTVVTLLSKFGGIRDARLQIYSDINIAQPIHT
jgi:type IV secretory pathway VirB4 component